MFLKTFIYTLSILLFSFIETYKPKIYSIQTVPLLHHVVTSSVSNYMLYNNSNFIVNIFDYKQEDLEPMVLYFPIFTCAYGLYDLYGGIYLNKRLDFLLHGIFFSMTGLIFMYYENFHWLYPGMLLETSSLILLFNHLPYNIIKYSFATSFLIYRNIIFPYISIIFIKNKYILLFEPYHYQEKGLLFFLMCFNCLNFFWGYKIMKKLIRHIKNE